MFGPAFRRLDDVRLGDGPAYAWAELPVSLEEGDDFPGAHPVLVDAALQLCWLAADEERGRCGNLPAGRRRSVVSSPGPAWQDARSRAPPRTVAGSSFTADVLIETAEGEPVVSIERMRFASADPSTVGLGDKRQRSVHDRLDARAEPVRRSGARQRARRVDRLRRRRRDSRQVSQPRSRRREGAAMSSAWVRLSLASAEREWVIDPAQSGSLSLAARRTGLGSRPCCRAASSIAGRST